jgi:hypothetical protein
MSASWGLCKWLQIEPRASPENLTLDCASRNYCNPFVYVFRATAVAIDSQKEKTRRTLKAPAGLRPGPNLRGDVSGQPSLPLLCSC